MCHPGFHRPCRHQNLRNEYIPLTELDADNPHPGNEPVVHDLEGPDSPVQCCPGQPIDGDVVSIDQSRGDVLHGGRHPAEQRYVPLDLFGPFEELLDLIADELVGYVR